MKHSVDSLKRRSIKRESKLWALDLAVRMTDLTTLEGRDTPGKIRALCAKGIQRSGVKPRDAAERLPAEMIPRLAALVLAVVAAGCGGGGPSATPGGDGTPGPTPGPAFTPGELRLRLVDGLGPRWWCDPDEYPVGRDEEQSAIERWGEVRADAELFEAVTDRLRLDPEASFSDAEKLAVYRLWKVAASIPFEAVPSGDGYRFEYLAGPAGGAGDGIRTIGIIDGTGAITVESRVASGEPICPICLAAGSRVDSPSGPVAIDRLRVGDVVWTLDASGHRVPGTVLAVASMTTPATHQVIRIALADGRTMTASPGHPLADGRTLGELAVGDLVDGSAIASHSRLPYAAGLTWDLLVTGSSGFYFVDGIPTASTIRPAAVAPAGS